jgi:hypothetical protein
VPASASAEASAEFAVDVTTKENLKGASDGAATAISQQVARITTHGQIRRKEEILSTLKQFDRRKR